MRAALASKCYLGVAISFTASVCGGCQDNKPVPADPPRRAVSSALPANLAPLALGPGAGRMAMAAPPPVTDAPAVSVSQSDVIGWAARGVSDEAIVDRIDHARCTFHLSAGDEVRLRDAGVSDDVIRAMKATVWN